MIFIVVTVLVATYSFASYKNKNLEELGKKWPKDNI